MGWREDAAAKFPRRPPSEPSNLRADLLDEIADHLAESLDHERRGGSIEHDLAWSRVIARFGDPTRLALQLWWQAMGEKVMREWIQTTLLAAMFIVLLVLAAGLYRQSQQTTAALTALATSIGQTAAPNPFRMIEFHATRGGDPNVPAPDLRIGITGSLFGAEQTSTTVWTNNTGTATLGPIHVGTMRIGLEDKSSDMRIDLSRTMFAAPGPEIIALQAPAIKPVTLEFQPPGVAMENVPYAFLFECRARLDQAGDENAWSTKYEFMILGGAGILFKTNVANGFTLQNPGEEEALATLRAAEQSQSEPVRPVNKVGDAHRVELPAATEISVVSFYVGIPHLMISYSSHGRASEPEGLSYSAQDFDVTPDKPNKIVYQLDDVVKEKIKDYVQTQTNPTNN